MSTYIKPVNKSLHYPLALLNSEEYPAFMQFTFYERKDMSGSTPIQRISLIMPNALKRPNTISFENTELGLVLGNSVNNARSGNGNFFAGVKETASNGSTYATAVENLIYKIGQTGTSMLGSNVTKDGLKGLVDNKISNPYFTMLFKGIELGQYEFEFTFTPNNEAETFVIKEIINSFRMHSSADKRDVNAHYLGYPNEVMITFWWKGEENHFIRKFKRSVITYIDVDDAPLGTMTLANNGANVNQILKLRLSETEIITREDISKGY